METKKRGRSMIEDYNSGEEQRIEMETETKRGRLIENESEFLPPEIKTEILSRLPADSAIGCKCISKQWRSLINHPSFLDTHTRQLISSSTSNPKKFGGNYFIPNSCTSASGFFLCALQENRKFQLQFVEYNDNDNVKEKLGVPVEFEPSKPIIDNPFPFYHKWGILMMSSCNGLVFMGSTKPNYVNDMFVCNPFTREYVNLRSTAARVDDEKEDSKGGGGLAYGFGYLSSTNEYKVVCIHYHDLEEHRSNANVSVYTLGSGGGWRNKGEIPYKLYSELNPGFFANGVIYWFTKTMKKKIVSFDLEDEKFSVVVPLPPPPPPPSANHVDKLGVLGGCICVTRSDKTRCESPKDIWVLNVHTKEEEGEKEFSWNKRFSIPWKGTASDAKPHLILRSGKILLRASTGLISYDPKTGAFNEDRQNTFYDPRLKVIPYTKSFVSLKALGEENAECFGGFVSHSPTQPPP